MKHSSNASRRLAWVVGLASLSACGRPGPVSLANPQTAVTSDVYESLLDRWTRDFEVLDVGGGLESRLGVTATYYSREFRHAYVARLGQMSTRSQEERGRMLAASLTAADEEHEFFVALVAQYPRWAELDRPTAAWRVRLIDDQGTEHEPLRIERSRTATATERALFYYWTPWRAVFHLRFAAQTAAGQPVFRPGMRHFILRFAGPYGTADLRWDVRTP
ncbi:MAG: hypothetical protein Q8Q09_12670 [Deltaproteobacteria bacterium]|nr:hypothetical protein [Deltaproteobacteria bacterium]